MDSKTNNIRVLAVSAHEHAAGTIAPHKLYSSDPASLYNAMRKAAWLADHPYDPNNKPGEKSVWARSNLSSYMQEDRRGTFPISKEIAHRRSKIMLMHSSEQRDAFREKLKAEQPNILFIGAMTLAMPGAIECAKIAREELGDKVLIVLGGYHVSETMYVEKKKEKKDKHEEGEQKLVNVARRGEEAPPVIAHHPGSPLLLMRKGEKGGGIPPLFDLVVAGRSEELIPEIGEIAGECLQKTGSVLKFKEYLKRKDIRNVPGNWILGYLEDGEMQTITGKDREIDYNDMPSPSKVFGVHTAFDVFEGRPTAHVFSDTGGGCSKDCHFCSERASSKGKLIDMAHAPDRLYKQMCDAATVIYEQYGRKKLPSAFVEDSILLGGSIDKMDRFCQLMEYGRDVNEFALAI